MNICRSKNKQHKLKSRRRSQKTEQFTTASSAGPQQPDVQQFTELKPYCLTIIIKYDLLSHIIRLPVSQKRSTLICIISAGDLLFKLASQCKIKGFARNRSKEQTTQMCFVFFGVGEGGVASGEGREVTGR